MFLTTPFVAGTVSTKTISYKNILQCNRIMTPLYSTCCSLKNDPKYPSVSCRTVSYWTISYLFIFDGTISHNNRLHVCYTIVMQ